MRAVIQRVTEADVSVEGKITGARGPGLMVLLGVEEGDSEKDAEYIAEKTRQTKPNIDIVFCAFDGEETGLQGSLAYAAAMTYQET